MLLLLVQAKPTLILCYETTQRTLEWVLNYLWWFCVEHLLLAFCEVYHSLQLEVRPRGTFPACRFHGSKSIRSTCVGKAG